MRLLRFLILPLPLFGGAIASAELLGTASVSTNYLWRGVTQTDDNPAIAATLEHRHAKGGYLGASVFNTRYGGEPGYEVDLYIGHLFTIKPATLDLAIRHYYFPTGGKYSYDFEPQAWDNEEDNAFTEIQLGVSREGWEGKYSYSNNYLDSGHSGYYLELSHTRSLTAKLSLTLHYGIQRSRAIDDIPEYMVGDYSATLLWNELFLTSSNMTDNADGRQSDRSRVVLGWSKTVRN